MEFGAQVTIASINIVKGDDDNGSANLDQCYHDLRNLPPGFRFHPTDGEIITHYLTPKVINPGFTASIIGQVHLNKIEPWDLHNKAKLGEKEWYFFCQRDRKYPKGMRTNRATDSGYWKATGKDKEIYNKHRGGSLVGMKKTLVFYKGRAPKGEKTNWVMHEFRLEGKFSYYNLPHASKSQDEWVVCRVVHKNSTIGSNNSKPINTKDDHEEPTRLNSFVDGLLNDPSLPADYDDIPATESNSNNNNINKNDNCQITEYEIKGKFIRELEVPSRNNNSNSITGLNNWYNYNVDSNTYLCQGNPVITNQPSNFQRDASSRGGAQPLSEQFIGRFKEEQYLSPHRNQSISHSQDTGVNTAHDMNTEISSSSSMQVIMQEDIMNPLLSVPSLSNFDAFWDY